MLWWTLQQVAICGLMAGLVALGCVVFRAGPAMRHALWLLVLIKMLTPPLVVWPWAVLPPLALTNGLPDARPIDGVAARKTSERMELVLLESSTPSQTRSHTLLNAARSAKTAEDAQLPASTSVDWHKLSASRGPVTSQWPSERLVGWLLCVAGTVWIVGSVILASIECVRISRLIMELGKATAPDARIERLVADIARRMGIRVPMTRVVPHLHSPVVWSFLRPQLLWPSEFPLAMTEDSVRGLIVHELAHLKRRDHWVGWMELLAGVAWWWNPLFWYVRHQLRQNAELACDAWVIEVIPKGRRAYAQALLTVCEWISSRTVPMPAAGVGTGGRRFIERRLTMILRERASLRLSRLGLLAVGLLAAATLPAWAQKPPEEAQRIATTSGELDAQHIEVVTDLSGSVVQELPADAQELLNQFDANQSAARREFETRMAQLREELIGRLRALQDRYTKAGQLDEAVAIRDRIRAIQRDGGPGIAVEPLADPGNLTAYRPHPAGQSFYFTVTGSTEGTIWGSGVYTDDSPLAVAAVHAGVLAPGEKGIVRVTILPGQESYDGSTRNGVTSDSYGSWQGSYRVESAGRRHRLLLRLDPSQGPPNLQNLRDKVGRSFEFEITGSTEGSVWGNDVYTDDSSLAAAAVHAGVLRDGQQGVVKVTILPAQDNYESSTRNGVTSQTWGQWGGSFRVEPADPKLLRPGSGGDPVENRADPAQNRADR